MRSIFFLFSLLVSSTTFSQGVEIGPIGGLRIASTEFNQSKALEGSFDSTFIYTSDTIDLPIFDDFSSDKFQQYNIGFTDPGVTSELWFKVLTDLSVPIGANEQFSSQVTYKSTYIQDSDLTEDVALPSVDLQLGDLSLYPVSYVPQLAFPPYFVYDTISTAGQIDLNPDTVYLTDPDIFQDSARIFFATLNSSEKIWLDSEARRNLTFAKDPWSIGVVTFDGVDAKGYPYEINTNITGIGDQLTSKPIDMSGFDAGDSVYFSFVFQRQGLGDEPEVGDSLVLEFYAHDLLQWNQVWSAQGGPVGDFEVGHILIDNPDYFKDGFQFRFQNYGSLAGMLDQFHVDYVNLRSLSGFQDTLFKDYAMVYPVNTLIKKYTSVPWDHWKNNFAGKMTDAATITVRNNSNIPENNQNGTIDVDYNNANETSFTLIGQTLSGGNINYAPRTTYVSYHDLSGGYHYDETKTGDKQTFEIIAAANAQFPNFSGNDTVRSEQVFANYYAYDDGTAENGFGTTGIQSRLAIKYEAYEADSLIGLDMCFVPTVDDVSDKLFLVTVWDDNNGEPGNVIYEDDLFEPRSPQYHEGFDKFTTYYLKDTMKLAINGPFYVGWRQFDADRLNVGFDRNIDNSENTYYSIDGGFSWPQSEIPGTAMIRPIFSTSLDYQLGLKKVERENKVNIFPNPTNDIINVELELGSVEKVEVFNISGALQVLTDQPTVNLSDLPQGMYFVRVNNLPKLYKIVKY